MRRCHSLLVVVIGAFVLALFGPCVAAAMDGLPVGVELTNMGSGSRGWVRIADDDGLEPQVFTIEVWVTPLGDGYGGTSDQYGSYIIGKPGEGGSGSFLASYALNWANSDDRVIAAVAHDIGSSGTRLRSTGIAPLGTRTHVAFSFDGVWLRIYINGQLDSEELATAGNVEYNDNDVLIGAGNYASGYLRAYQGVVDDVRIWDYARDAGEISAQMSCSLEGDEPGLLAYYSFNAGDCSDDSGNGHDGAEDGLVSYVLSNDECLPFVSDMERGDLSDWTADIP